MLKDVSETALWAAVLRAQETARPDALFRDPFAERLAGPRGKAIAERLARLDRGANGWAMVVRTRLIDDLVESSVAQGCDCVLSLAAGLDSRPYRLKLPRNLRWIEADLPHVVRAKEAALATDVPGCELRRVALDLTDGGACERLLTTVARAAQSVLVLSEGVLLYLHEPKVRSLANALATSPAVQLWVADIASPGVLAMMRQRLGAELTNAPPRFGPADGVAYFERLGWATRDVFPLLPEGIRLARVPHLFRPFGGVSAPDPRRLGRQCWSAVVLFERQRSARLVG